jgi:hypothetical protein
MRAYAQEPRRSQKKTAYDFTKRATRAFLRTAEGNLAGRSGLLGGASKIRAASLRRRRTGDPGSLGRVGR